MPAMEHDVPELMGTLADPTRYAVYRWLAGQPHRAFSAREIASQFGLHPNVARQHLVRLEHAGLVVGCLRRSPRGGRPGRVYQMAEKPLSVQLPARDFQLLAVLALQALASLGPEGARALEEKAQSQGEAVGMAESAAGVGREGCELGLRAALERIFSREGIMPVVEEEGQDREEIAAGPRRRQEAGSRRGLLSGKTGIRTFRLRVQNCPFKEVPGHLQSLVCAAHASFLTGVVRGAAQAEAGPATGRVSVRLERQIIRGAEGCSYRIAVGQDAPGGGEPGQEFPAARRNIDSGARP